MEKTLATFIQEQMHALGLFQYERTFARNEPVYHLDDPADEIYLLVEGRVKISRLSDEGKEKIISIYRQGQIFGELCFCEVEGRRSDQATAMEPTTVSSVKVEDFLRAMRENPKTLFDMLSLFCGRLSDAQQQIETLSFDNTTRRLSRAIIRAAEDAEAAGVDRIKLTHEELAQMVGTSREIITTIMNRFRDLGLLDYRRSEVKPKIEKLRDFLLRES